MSSRHIDLMWCPRGRHRELEMNRRSNWSTLTAMMSAGLVAGTVAIASAADVPGALTHQGRLFDAQGNPITDTVSMTFSFYDDANAAAPLASETHDVMVEDGYYSVSVGDTLDLK